MWIVQVSQPGVSLSEAWKESFLTVYRGHWLWQAKLVYWFYKTYMSNRVIILDREEKAEK